MKRALLLFGFLLLPIVLVSPASAQEIPEDCLIIQNEDEEVVQQQIDEECVENNEGRNLEKGEPSPETVAGNEEIVAPPPVVLGATTEDPAVLAATGVNALLAIPAGMFIIAISLAITRLAKEKYKINK